MVSGYNCGMTLNIKESHGKAFDTCPKPVCLILQKDKIQNFRFCHKERLIDPEGANGEDERPNPQIHLLKVQSSGFFCVKGRLNERG